MQSTRIISIITTSYNQGEFLGDTIRSVISQEGDFFIDYLIIDGGSSDRSLDVIREHEKHVRIAQETVRMRHIEFHVRDRSAPNLMRCRGLSYRWISENDRGQVHALNKGLRMAKGDIIAFLNSDDTYYPGTLERISETDWKESDFIYGRGMWISRNGEELLPYPVFKPKISSFAYQCTLCQPSVFIKKETIAKLGLFNEDFDLVFDFEYWMRAVFNGMKFKFLNAFLAASRFYDNNKTMAQREKQAQELACLMQRYYTSQDSFTCRIKKLAAKYTVHWQTVRRVNKLMSLIESPIRHKF